MAGLREVCTHLEAVIYYLETVSRIQGKPTCTQTECAWLIPSYYKNIEYKPVDFTSVKGKKKLEMLGRSPSSKCTEDGDNGKETKVWLSLN